MRIAFIGLGKLGMPVAVCLSRKHQVVGYDPAYTTCLPFTWPHRETGPDGKEPFQPYYDEAVGSYYRSDNPTLAFYRDWPQESPIKIARTMAKAVEGAELIFLCIQTPHAPEYEGITPLPFERADFDYSYLKQAVAEVCEHTTDGQILVIISTVLPGTLRREILPLITGRGCSLVYNPAFPAMGTVMRDFLRPEFVLLGADDLGARDKVAHFYCDLLDGGEGSALLHDESCSLQPMSIESAELAKVAYNCAISTKIALANTLMEICHKTPGCDVDDVIGVLKSATRRIVSEAYMDAGMGDGGGCHPRDGIAMSWLARKLNLSYDLFGQMMEARESQAQWLAGLVVHHAVKGLPDKRTRGEGDPQQRPVVILGKAYKPESNLTSGSPALLVANILKGWGAEFDHYDPFVENTMICPMTEDGEHQVQLLGPSVFLIATKHEIFRTLTFPAGSTVIDPFRYLNPQEGVTLIPVGVGVGT